MLLLWMVIFIMSPLWRLQSLILLGEALPLLSRLPPMCSTLAWPQSPIRWHLTPSCRQRRRHRHQRRRRMCMTHHRLQVLPLWSLHLVLLLCRPRLAAALRLR